MNKSRTKADIQKRQNEIEAKIKEVFPAASRIDFGFYYYGDSVSKIYFSLEHEQLTFDGLQKLSEYFATKLINFKTGSITTGCESCGAGSSAMVKVGIEGIKES